MLKEMKTGKVPSLSDSPLESIAAGRDARFTS